MRVSHRVSLNVSKVQSWLDERFGLGPFWRSIFLRHIPIGLNWWYSLGSAALFVFVIEAATGILLAMNYSPTPEYAYDSVRFITYEQPFGWLIRGLHHWGASAMVVLVLLHLVSVLVMGAYKYPREGIWIVGVGLLLLTLAYGFTGYLLPWDQKAYWATTVGTNMVGTIPVIGGDLLKLIRGGTGLGVVALTRFFAVHALLLPVLLGALAAVHVALVIYHGVSVSPGLWHKGLPGQASTTDGGAPLSYHERYAAFKARGPNFWPELITEDLRTALVVFVVLVGLTVFFGVPLDERADPTDTTYIPRPEWYFMALFEMLKFFPGQLEWVGAALLPALLVLLVLFVPALARGEERRPLRRPAGMATLALVLIALTGMTIRAYATTPPSAVVERGVVLTSQQLRGRQLTDQQGCRSCHIIGGVVEVTEPKPGEREKVKGPRLDGIGARLTTADIHTFMEQPKRFNPDATMEPVIPPLNHADVEAITQYLLTLSADIPLTERSIR